MWLPPALVAYNAARTLQLTSQLTFKLLIGDTCQGCLDFDSAVG